MIPQHIQQDFDQYLEQYRRVMGKDAVLIEYALKEGYEARDAEVEKLMALLEGFVKAFIYEHRPDVEQAREEIWNNYKQQHNL